MERTVPDGEIARVPLYSRKGDIRDHALIDKEDEILVNEFSWRLMITKVNKRYAVRWTGYQLVMLHRFLLPVPPEKEVDHINGNGLDNRKENLRPASDTENSRNRRVSNRSTGYKGVTLSHSLTRYEARITIDRKTKRIGSYLTVEEAALAYNAAASEAFGEFAHLNKIMPGSADQCLPRSPLGRRECKICRRWLNSGPYIGHMRRHVREGLAIERIEKVDWGTARGRFEREFVEFDVLSVGEG